jgi:hypothetical protein
MTTRFRSLNQYQITGIIVRTQHRRVGEFYRRVLLRAAIHKSVEDLTTIVVRKNKDRILSRER